MYLFTDYCKYTLSVKLSTIKVAFFNHAKADKLYFWQER